MYLRAMEILLDVWREACRHIEITEPIRKFATDRVERLRGVADEVLEVHFILTVEKHQRHVAELNLKTNHQVTGCPVVRSGIGPVAPVTDIGSLLLRFSDIGSASVTHSALT